MSKKNIIIAVVVVGLVIAGTVLAPSNLFQGRLTNKLNNDFQRKEPEQVAKEYTPIVLTMVLENNKAHRPRLYWTDPNPKPTNGINYYNIYRSYRTPVEFKTENFIGTSKGGINFNDFPTEIGTYYYAIEIDASGATGSRSNEVSTTLTQKAIYLPAE